MRVASLGVARPAFYDRNATSLLLSYSSTEGPHSQITRWTTTVATGNKLLVELANARLLTVTAATSKGIYDYGSIYITSGATTISYVDVSLDTNTVGAYRYVLSTQGPTIYAGETIFAATAGNSTGGTIQYVMQIKGTTYSA